MCCGTSLDGLGPQSLLCIVLMHCQKMHRIMRKELHQQLPSLLTYLTGTCKYLLALQILS